MRPRMLRTGVLAGALSITTCLGALPTPAHADSQGAVAVRLDRVRVHVTVGRSAHVSGRVAPASAGLPVRLQVRRDRRWRTLDRTLTAGDGRFRLSGRMREALSAHARVTTAGVPGLRGGRRRVGRLEALRSAQVSWYGPGLYGGRLACGGTLTARTLGVANRSLPCGSRVTLRHDGRRLRVPVVDRGPYAGDREYDLTAATAQKLGFEGHGALLVSR